ncbi:transporter substrate-binding domain-containing protein [Arthrobacter sp. W4I7]|uniref:transporter substrate-binding domain-containing protein n=1 Tax=Arthrobacter sp. W4I7 TaxID=3042296 RepID=UPI00278347F4|nr:transporter substrate-binding domain-containing protein [Arthrobacter sp. W4I7]MDQ0693070.1 polar amino acid transport system substrate-binding protein [Arthrobacter sp. W4I7]
MKISAPYRVAAVAAGAVLALTACAGPSQQSTPSPAAAGGVNKSAKFYDSLPQSIKDKGEIVFAGDSHPPYRSVGADGKTVTGIDPDLQKALTESLGVPARIEITEGLPQMLTGMKSGRYDAFNGPVKATPDRLKEFDGVSWLSSRTSYVIPTTNGIDAKGTDGLCGTTTAGVKGSITEEQTAKLSTWCGEQGKQPVTFLGLADTNATILAVKSQRAQSAATTQTGAIDLMAQEKDKWRYVSQTDEQGAGVDQLVLLAPKSSGLGPVLQKAFVEIFDNGKYKEIVDRWGLDDVAVEAPVLNPGAS